jgi:ankyrin repeat protein
MFLEAGADPNRVSDGNPDEGLPLCAAATWGYVDVARLLLAAGADPDLPEDQDGHTARRCAQRWEQRAILELF